MTEPSSHERASQRASTEQHPKYLRPREGRSQLALRTAIDKVQQRRWGEFTEDDLHLLREAHEVIAKRYASGEKNCKRLVELLAQVLKVSKL